MEPHSESVIFLPWRLNRLSNPGHSFLTDWQAGPAWSLWPLQTISSEIKLVTFHFEEDNTGYKHATTWTWSPGPDAERSKWAPQGLPWVREPGKGEQGEPFTFYRIIHAIRLYYKIPQINVFLILALSEACLLSRTICIMMAKTKVLGKQNWLILKGAKSHHKKNGAPETNRSRDGLGKWGVNRFTEKAVSY